MACSWGSRVRPRSGEDGEERRASQGQGGGEERGGGAGHGVGCLRFCPLNSLSVPMLWYLWFYLYNSTLMRNSYAILRLSRTTSAALLSSRSPKNTGCRRPAVVRPLREAKLAHQPRLHPVAALHLRPGDPLPPAARALRGQICEWAGLGSAKAPAARTPPSIPRGNTRCPPSRRRASFPFLLVTDRTAPRNISATLRGRSSRR